MTLLEIAIHANSAYPTTLTLQHRSRSPCVINSRGGTAERVRLTCRTRARAPAGVETCARSLIIARRLLAMLPALRRILAVPKDLHPRRRAPADQSVDRPLQPKL